MKTINILLYCSVMLLFVPLAFAVTVETDKNEYATPEQVQVTITSCMGNSILQVTDAAGRLVDINAGRNNWQAVYNTESSQAAGKYTIQVNCDDGEATINFCVDENGCLGAVVPAGDGGNDAGGGSSSGGDSSSGGRGKSPSGGVVPVKPHGSSCPPNSTLVSGSCVCAAGLELRGGKCQPASSAPRQPASSTTRGSSSPSAVQQTAPSQAAPQPAREARPAPIVEQSTFWVFWEAYSLYVFIGAAVLLVLVIVLILVEHRKKKAVQPAVVGKMQSPVAPSVPQTSAGKTSAPEKNASPTPSPVPADAEKQLKLQRLRRMYDTTVRIGKLIHEKIMASMQRKP